jgi:hypothetical protein
MGSLFKTYFFRYANGPRSAAVNIMWPISTLEIKAADQSEDVNSIT